MGLVDQIVRREKGGEDFWLDGGQRYVVCAFYTPNYQDQIQTLKASLEALNINYYFKRYESRGGWEANTRIKAEFVAHALQRWPNHDVVYLDADAVVRQPLALFETATADVTMLFDHRRRGNISTLRLAAGTLLVRNTPGGRKFATRWADEADKASALDLDEDLIYRMFPTLDGVTFAVLPQRYSKIFDAPGIDPVVEHFQASRGQFKWRRFARQARQIATVIGGIALAVFLWWLSTRIVVGWR
jgi:Nucleotide-diphospho-sugar transferase